MGSVELLPVNKATHFFSSIISEQSFFYIISEQRWIYNHIFKIISEQRWIIIFSKGVLFVKLLAV